MDTQACDKARTLIKSKEHETTHVQSAWRFNSTPPSGSHALQPNFTSSTSARISIGCPVVRLAVDLGVLATYPAVQLWFVVIADPGRGGWCADDTYALPGLEKSTNKPLSLISPMQPKSRSKVELALRMTPLLTKSSFVVRAQPSAAK